MKQPPTDNAGNRPEAARGGPRIAALAPWLESVDGPAPILLIAPHGGRAGESASARLNPKVNDLGTAEIARRLAARLDAAAFINSGMDRNLLDCNRLGQLTEHAPWLLDLIAARIERMLAEHGRATILLIHGWNVIEPRVDLGLGLRHNGAALHPPAGAFVSASNGFIHERVAELARQLSAAGIIPSFGLRYPGGAAHNLLQAFTPRHRESRSEPLRRLARIAADRQLNAIQLELSVALRLPGELFNRNLDAITRAFGPNGHNAKSPTDAAPPLQIERHVAPPLRTTHTVRPVRVGIEFYDPGIRLGAIASFDLGARASGGRIMVLFDRTRVAMFTGEGKVSRSGSRLSLGPLALDADQAGGSLSFRGPAVIVQDGSQYLNVEHALASGTLDDSMTIDARLESIAPGAGFGTLLDAIEKHGTEDGSGIERLMAASGWIRATFCRLTGSVKVAGRSCELNAVARVGLSFSALLPEVFTERQMIWACFSKPLLNQRAIEARLVVESGQTMQTARTFNGESWSPCGLSHLKIESSSVSTPPERIAALITPSGCPVQLTATPETFMALSRPGQGNRRIHTSLGFARFTAGAIEGAGMFEYSRVVPNSGDPEEEPA